MALLQDRMVMAALRSAAAVFFFGNLARFDSCHLSALNVHDHVVDCLLHPEPFVIVFHRSCLCYFAASIGTPVPRRLGLRIAEKRKSDLHSPLVSS